MCLCCSFPFGSLNPSSILFCSVLCFGRLTSLHVLHPDSLISDFQWDSVNGKLPEGKRRKWSNIDPSSPNLPTWLRFGHWLCLSLTIALFNLLFFCLQSSDRVTLFTWFGLSDPMLIKHLAIESYLSLLFLHPLWVPQTLPLFLWKSLFNDIFNKLFSYTISRPPSVGANIWVTLYLN